MPFSLLLIVAAVLASGPVRADCELLYAPAETRARLLAFHHVNELRRAREQAHAITAGTGKKPGADPHRLAPARGHDAPANPRSRPR